MRKGANVSTWITTPADSARAAPTPKGFSATTVAASKRPTEAGSPGTSSENVVATATTIPASRPRLTSTTRIASV
jgi:hypothetical protein